MGTVFGVVSEESHAFTVVETHSKYEVREYAAGTFIESENDREAFSRLAGYIGVMKKPQNARGQAIAMTTPVVTNDAKMLFVLPADVDAPDPTDPNVTVVKKDKQTAVVATWFGGWSDDVAATKRDDLVAAATADGFRLDADRWEWRRHNPPWTLPVYKKNEVYVPLIGR